MSEVEPADDPDFWLREVRLRRARVLPILRSLERLAADWDPGGHVPARVIEDQRASFRLTVERIKAAIRFVALERLA